ncbi:MAG: hypothetical protein ACYC7I_08985, partial [Gammaproteobacteria bacterium]
LDRHKAIDNGIQSFVYDTHRTAAQLRDYFVLADFKSAVRHFFLGALHGPQLNIIHGEVLEAQRGH